MRRAGPLIGPIIGPKIGSSVRLGLAAFLLTATTLAGAGTDTQLKDVRLWAAPDRTRVVFDLDGPVEHKLFTLDNPQRVVIDVPNTQRAQALAEDLAGKGFISKVRTGVHAGHDLRIVLDLKQSAIPKSFVLAPNGDYGHRLVVDLDNGVKNPKRQPVASELSYSVRNFVVAIDAGHGGEDPGASGPRGTREKDVVLEIARRLAKLVDKQPEMKAVLIRDGDYYVGLRERIEKARESKADLFVSIHADAFRDQRAHGSSVYVLSSRGATSEHARWLAQRENAADLVGGVSLKDKDDALASFMLDLSQSASIEASLDVGKRLLSGLRGLGHVHKTKVQQAGFMVLKSPDIPSVLIETAFISNPSEENKLRSSSHQNKLASALLNGIKGYVASYRPAVYANGSPREHKVKPGDTVSGIAQKYGVDAQQLRRVNDLKNDLIQVGRKLTIPQSGDTLAASTP